MFFSTTPSTTAFYPLSLHDALPISFDPTHVPLFGYYLVLGVWPIIMGITMIGHTPRDRKSTRLNSSHQIISYAVFCLKKKNTSTRRSTAISKTNPTRPSESTATAFE